MAWISVKKRIPPVCDDILFTDGDRIYIGWLESYDPLEDLVFTCAVHNHHRETCWPDGITHWMRLPKLPKEEEEECVVPVKSPKKPRGLQKSTKRVLNNE